MLGTKILIVDDVSACEMLKTHFEGEGCAVIVSHGGAEALDLVKGIHPDLVLLGGELPHWDGADMLAALRKDSNVPVLMMTERREMVDRVLLLEMGADDVMVKPVHLRELTARAKAILRRVQNAFQKESSDVIKFDNFEISQEKFELKLKGKKVEIPPKELQLLYCLASSPNRVFSRERLLEHVWDFAFLGDSRTVDVHIKRLREKLEGASDKWALTTVWGVGYKFELK